MCGIYAYCGSGDALDMVLMGLRRLEYRGYDSWGVAGVLDNGSLSLVKRVGRVPEKVQSLPRVRRAIGHTRWATHGGVTQNNAHPHLASDGSFALVHNGIVENYVPLKEGLIKDGYRFVSETDTEVIVRLVEKELLHSPTLSEAVRVAFTKLEGRNTIGVLSGTGEIITARNGSPLVVGSDTETGAIVFASDALSLAGLVDRLWVLDNGMMACLGDSSVCFSQIRDGKQVWLESEPMGLTQGSRDKGDYAHYMLKEIFETPEALKAVAAASGKAMRQLAGAIDEAGSVYVIGSGTAGLAAEEIAYFLRSIAHVPAVSLVGAEASEYIPLFDVNTLVIAPSQSGETADVLEVLGQAKAVGARIATYVNMQGSTMTRMADYAFMADAGPEICVMSTKIFTSQIAWGYLLAHEVAGSGGIARGRLRDTAGAIQNYLADPIQLGKARDLGERIATLADVYLMGRGPLLTIAREGMIKLIEGSYIHAHAVPAGDLKHYAITLMEPGVVVLAVGDVGAAASEIVARGAEVVCLPLLTGGDTAAITAIVPLQLVAYYSALALGHDVDRPRNIAKSVTVK